jgi:hypothetical protein
MITERLKLAGKIAVVCFAAYGGYALFLQKPKVVEKEVIKTVEVERKVFVNTNVKAVKDRTKTTTKPDGTVIVDKVSTKTDTNQQVAAEEKAKETTIERTKYQSVQFLTGISSTCSKGPQCRHRIEVGKQVLLQNLLLTVHVQTDSLLTKIEGAGVGFVLVW